MWACRSVCGAGGRLRLIGLIEQADVVVRVLRHLGFPTEVPGRVRPAGAATALIQAGR